MAQDLRSDRNAEVLEEHAAIGIYEGPLVPLAGPEGMVHVHPSRIISATGAVESHPVFPGNNLPGVWLGRGAARRCGIHRTPMGSRAVIRAKNGEGHRHMETQRAAGMEVAALV